MAMDRMGRLGGSAEIADDAFQESMARLSVHLATRHPTHVLPDPLPPPRRFRIPWPYVLLVAIAGAVAYPYYQWLVQDDAPRPATPRAAAAIPAPTPVLAAIAVAPEAAPPPPPASMPVKTEPTVIDVAAAIPPPPQPAPPVTLPAPASPVAHEPETALSRSEVVEIQKRLASLNINPGPIDGIVGPRTIASVQKYEARVGRAATGKVDRNLLTLLRQAPGASPKLQAHAP
jgi:hypothetical protein